MPGIAEQEALGTSMVQILFLAPFTDQAWSSWLPPHCVAQVLLWETKVTPGRIAHVLGTGGELFFVPTTTLHPVHFSIMQLKSQAELGLKTHQKSPILYVAFLWSSCMDTEGRKKKCNTVIHEKSMLEINLRYRCTFYYGTRQSLYIAIAIM